MELRKILAQNVRRLRRGKRLTQDDLAGMAHIDRTYVSDIERCIYAATVDVLEELAWALEVEPSELLTARAPSERPAEM
ncbi:helix-turn-helix transcriptional regulator [Phenylobacterium sp.]|jgi:transcriptional regulator with XRE-family HTH domain|uniref:helix-turn-helix domain-containing protein n=1 Tax=Phenylobacterium sp. TaxID=1871053 RepID=UPI002F3FFF05